MNQGASKMLRKINVIMDGTEKTYKALKKDYKGWSDEKKQELKSIMANVEKEEKEKNDK